MREDFNQESIERALARARTSPLFLSYLVFLAYILLFLPAAVAAGIWQMPLGRAVLVNLSPETLDALGALVRLKVQAGDHYRLVTAMFIHFSLIHILMGSICFLSIGRLVERLYGARQMLIAFTISGIVGNVAVCNFEKDLVPVGTLASLFGLSGALLGFVLRHRRLLRARESRAIAASSLLWLAFWLIAGVVWLKVGPAPPLFGFAAGLFLGLIFLPRAYLGFRRRIALNVLSAFIVGILVWSALSAAFASGGKPGKSFWEMLSGRNGVKKYENTLLRVRLHYPEHFNVQEEESAIVFFRRGATFCRISFEKRSSPETAAEIAKKRMESFYFNPRKVESATDPMLVSEKRLTVDDFPSVLYQFLYKNSGKEYLFTECVIVREDSVIFVDFHHLSDDRESSDLREGMLNSLCLLPVPGEQE